MAKLIKFGEDVPGYNIPVMNEREIRAAAGILFLFTYTSLMAIIFKGYFPLIKYVITGFLTDFIIRVFINPKYAPTLILGRLIVKNQTPEYVGAIQKKFAWVIGIILASTMFILMVVVNSYSPITGIICLICLIFLFFESVFGICLGCKFFSLIYKEKAQYCPGEVCEVKDRQAIQKISWQQILILIGFIIFVVLLVIFFHESFSIKPTQLFGQPTVK
jgi:hypothetical protein